MLLGLQLKKLVTSIEIRKGCWARMSSWQQTVDAFEFKIPGSSSIPSERYLHGFSNSQNLAPRIRACPNGKSPETPRFRYGSSCLTRVITGEDRFGVIPSDKCKSRWLGAESSGHAKRDEPRPNTDTDDDTFHHHDDFHRLVTVIRKRLPPTGSE